MESLTPELVTAILAGVTAMVVAVGTMIWKTFKDLLTLFNQLKSDQQAIKSEVQNSHDTNLRDDMDEKHEEQMLFMRKLSGHVAQIDKTMAEDRQYARQEFNNIWKMLNLHHPTKPRGLFKRGKR